MDKKIHFFIYLLLLIYSFPSIGQNSNDSIKVTIKPYVGLRGHLAAYDQELELQENASRFGAELTINKGKIGFIAGTEIQINMFKGSSTFNVDGNLSGGFLNIKTTQNQQVFGNRLGYLGVDFGSYGKVTIGKQWSVYRDVTSYTDRFNVFGARASATFIGGTDGGENGTGRADQSLIYRNKIGSFHFGSQFQIRGGNNSKFIDGFGLSAQFELINDFFIGVAYNRAFLSENLRSSGKILGLSGHPTYISVGTKYKNRHIEFSALAVMQENGDFTQGIYSDFNNEIVKPTIVFNAKGIELFSKYKFQTISLHAGYNLYVPSIKNITTDSGQFPINSAFKRNDIIAGISYQPLQYVQIYSEQRLSFGKSSLGEKEKSVFTLGMKIDISKKFTTTISDF